MQTHAQFSISAEREETDLKKKATLRQMKKRAQRKTRMQQRREPQSPEPGHRSRFYLSPTMKSEEIEALERLEKSMEIKKAANDADVDLDDGWSGIADYGSNGQVAMRVQPNDKCNGCQHYDQNVSACAVGLVPSVCGDGSYPEIGYSPVSGNRIAAKNWINRMKDTVVTSTQAEDIGPANPPVPYRIDVLGDSTLALAEKMDLVKSWMEKAAQSPEALAGWIWYHKMSPDKRMAAYKQHDPKAIKTKKMAHLKAGRHRPPKGWFDKLVNRLKTKNKKSKKARKSEFDPYIAEAMTDTLGFAVMPLVELEDLAKSVARFDDIGSFAHAMGTTEDVVRDIARRLGDKQAFAQFIKSKLPDIMMSHGLDEAGVNRLYAAATATMKSLSMTEWESWKGVSFEEGVTDEALANAIAERGLLDTNACYKKSIITPAEPVPALPEPEPIQVPQQTPMLMGGDFVGGNLHLADSLVRRG